MGKKDNENTGLRERIKSSNEILRESYTGEYVRKLIDAQNRTNTNFFQVIEQSDEEKMEMYMKLTKREIIHMLIECNKIIMNHEIKIDYGK